MPCIYNIKPEDRICELCSVVCDERPKSECPQAFTVLADGVEYYPKTNELLLLRCPKCGKENYVMNVLSGICTWCGYDAHELMPKDEA